MKDDNTPNLSTEKMNQAAEEMKQEHWQIVATETAELLETIELCLLKLEDNPQDTEIINQLFRAFHTFKGTAGMMALSTTEKLSHCAEDLMVLVRDKGAELTSEVIDLFFVTQDKLQEARKYAVENHADISLESVKDLIEQLTQQKNIAEATLIQEPDIELLTPADNQIADNTVNDAPTDSENISSVNGELFDKAFFDNLWPLLLQIRQSLETYDQHESGQMDAMAKKIQGLRDLVTDANVSDIFGDVELLQQMVTSDEYDVNTAAESLTRLYSSFWDFEDQVASQTTVQTPEPQVTSQTEDITVNDAPTDSESISSVSGEFFDNLWPLLLQIKQILETYNHHESGQVNSVVKKIQGLRDLVTSANLSDFIDDVELLQKMVTGDEYDADTTAVLLRRFYTRFWDLEDLVASQTTVQTPEPQVTAPKISDQSFVESTALGQKTIDNNALDFQMSHYEEISDTLKSLSKCVDELDGQVKAWLSGSIVQQQIEQLTKEINAHLADTYQFCLFYELKKAAQLTLSLVGLFNCASYEQSTYVSRTIAFSKDFITRVQSLVDNLSIGEQANERPIEALLQRCEQVFLSDMKTHEPISYRRKLDGEEDRSLIQTALMNPKLDQYPEIIPQTIGQLIASYAALSGLTELFEDTELFNQFEKQMNKAEGNWHKAKFPIKEEIDRWEEHLNSLFQTQEDIGKNLEQLQSSVSSLRERPIRVILPPLQAWIKEVCLRLNKIVKLDIAGEDTLIDLKLLSGVEQPIRKLLLFALTTSIETADQRIQAGKPAIANIRINIRNGEGYILLEIIDDGKGLDIEKMQQQAKQFGWNDVRSDVEQLILKSGFGSFGGDGKNGSVDFYALKQQLELQDITFNLSSHHPQGIRFSLRVPLSKNVIDGMVVQVGNTRYVIPIHSIRCIIAPDELSLLSVSIEQDNRMLKLEDEIVPIKDISANNSLNDNNQIMVVIQKTPNNIAIGVDHLLGIRQVMVTPKLGQLKQVKMISGCAVLGMNDVGMVLDVDQL